MRRYSLAQWQGNPTLSGMTCLHAPLVAFITHWEKSIKDDFTTNMFCYLVSLTGGYLGGRERDSSPSNNTKLGSSSKETIKRMFMGLLCTTLTSHRYSSPLLTFAHLPLKLGSVLESGPLVCSCVLMFALLASGCSFLCFLLPSGATGWLLEF